MEMRIPDKIECLKILRRENVPPHIVAHSIKVSLVALLITRLLKENGITLCENLIEAASLLHDISKARCLKTGENHAIIGANLISDMGFPEIGNIVRQHVRLDEYFANEFPGEVEVVNYADKVVKHDKVVSMEERMKDILERYAINEEIRERIEKHIEKSKELEKWLFSFLSISPELIPSLVKEEDFTRLMELYETL